MDTQALPDNRSHRVSPCARMIMERDPSALAAWAVQFTPVDEDSLPPDQRDYVEKVRSQIHGMKLGRLGEDLYGYTTEDGWGPLKFKLPFPLKHPAPVKPPRIQPGG